MSEIFYMTPGPTKIPFSVLKAMIRGPIMPGDPEFIKVMDDTEWLLEKLFHTKNWVLFFPGSGRVTIEAAFLSVLEAGEKVLLPINGVFGKWLGIIVERLGGKPVKIELDWRKAIDPVAVKEVLDKESDIRVVGVVHNETATGIVNPVSEIGRIVHDYGALYLVDSVSSLGGDDVKTDDWKIDLNCTGSYKCINSVPGLSILSVSYKAWDVMARRKRVAKSYGFDLYRWLEMWIPPERGGKLIWGFRRHPIEPAPHLTYALQEATRLLLEEGLENRFRKNRIAGQAVRAGAKAIGLELYPLDESYASNTATAIISPKNVKPGDIVSTMKYEFGVEIGGGVEETHEKVFRIAHMSSTSDEMHILETLSSLERTLEKLGYRLERGKAIESAREVYC